MGFTHVQSIHSVEGGHGLGLAQVPKPNVSIGAGNVDRGYVYGIQRKERELLHTLTICWTGGKNHK